MNDLKASLDGIDVRHLRYFQEVAALGSVSEAASSLGLAQPSLSQQIIRLEDKLHVKLFKRVPSGVELTADGERLLPVADHFTSALGKFIRETASPAVSFRIGISAGIPSAVLQSLERATKLDGSFPDCRMEYQALPSSKQIDLLRAKRLDLGLIHTVAPMNDLIVQGIGSFPLGVYLSTDHPLASRDSLSWNDLVQQRLLWFKRSFAPGYSEYILDHLRAHGWRPELEYVTPSRALFEYTLSHRDDVVALRPQSAVENNSQFRWFALDDPPREEVFAAVHPKSKAIALIPHLQSLTELGLTPSPH
ncbi:LysR family transcriptional regulator [Psychromicrobium lacuslunae]|uniref:HTH lysR-type domain-containing protein n=1 Tax=Psychromicrobium lacuslunae TaxID=1618207 RepID=A0A0D4BZZ9_9MICC|nr:LysR family transcriptional regulator [Psychromicrobium lacuslunae]AJT41725.1 hypothetical protein UM93_09750 [Psychromicrobium lacuslunae]